MPFPIEDFIITRHLATNAIATNQIAMIAPFDLDIVSVEERHRVASTSGTLDVVVSADAVTVAAGVSVLTAVMSLSGAAETKVTGSLVTTIGGRRVPKGSAIGLKFAGNLANLLDSDITIRCRQVKKF